MTGEGVSRRDFLRRAGAVAAGVAMPGAVVEVFDGLASAAEGPDMPPDAQQKPELCGTSTTIETSSTTPEIPLSAVAPVETVSQSPESVLLEAGEVFKRAIKEYYANMSPKVIEKYQRVTARTRSYDPEISDDGNTIVWRNDITLSEARGEDGKLAQSSITFEDTTALFTWQTGEDGSFICIPSLSSTPRPVQKQILDSTPDTSLATQSTAPTKPTSTLPSQGGYPPGYDPSSPGSESAPSPMPMSGGTSAEQVIGDVQSTLAFLEQLAA